jgi:hypothetical protein
VQAAKAEALRKKTGGLFVAQSSKAPKVRVCAVACTESCASLLVYCWGGCTLYLYTHLVA